MQKSNFPAQPAQTVSPLDDIFINSYKSEWDESKQDNGGSTNFSFVGDISFLDEASKSVYQHPPSSFNETLPILRDLPVSNAQDIFTPVTEVEVTCNEQLSRETPRLESESMSEKTEFSGYLSGEKGDSRSPNAINNQPHPVSRPFSAPTLENSKQAILVIPQQTYVRKDLQKHVAETTKTEYSGYLPQDQSNSEPTQIQPLPPTIGSFPAPLMESSNPPTITIPERPYCKREVTKPPSTLGIGIEDLKAVFHLERPKAEKKLGLRRTTFSNLSRHFGISKWPFRTIRDSLNRMDANKVLLSKNTISKERRRKLLRQQKHLKDVIKLVYDDPKQSRDSNTLAVLLMIVSAKDKL